MAIQRLHYQKWLSQIPDLETKMLLDIGCGPLDSYSTNFPIRQNAIVSDLHKSSLDYTLLYGFKSVCADMLALPFNSKIFDIVSTGRLLHLLNSDNERERAISESKRVLVPGGYLIGNFIPNFDSPFKIINPFLARFAEKLIKPQIKEELDKYMSIVTKNGFKLLNTTLGFYDQKHAYIPNMNFLEFYFLAKLS